MFCYCCDADNWQIRADLNPKSKVHICKGCGNIQHYYDESREHDLLEFYRKDYRGKITKNNLITTTHKLNYIRPFLKEYLDGKKGLICCDIGAATGYFVNFLRGFGHKALGTEYTPSMRRFSEHYYNIPLTEEIETKHKYDFISFYHTLEHMIAPDKKLKKYRDCLKDDGVMFISVPNWLFELEDLSAGGALTIQNYFHENHVCCYTEHSFQNLMNKCELEIIKKDVLTYGLTVLVKKCEPRPIAPQDWQEINTQIDKIKKAIELYAIGKIRDSLEIWPRFAEGWSRLIFDLYRKDEGRQASEFDAAEKALGENCSFSLAKATWHYQYARYEEAYKLFEWVAAHRMNEDVLIYMAWCLENLGQHKDAMNFFTRAHVLNPLKWAECSDFVCSIASKLPAWDEVAREQLKEQLFEKAAPNLELKDIIKMESENADKKS
jgi:2-polyprenyl-3-methyl-5-hydroxy-6-metoxy-1,4-benzoquinol methylase